MRFIETFQAGPFADTVVSLLAAFVLGIDAVLRYADSSLQIGASTLLLKRVEQGEVIDIAHLLAWLEAFVATRADDYA